MEDANLCGERTSCVKAVVYIQDNKTEVGVAGTLLLSAGPPRIVGLVGLLRLQ